MSDAKTPEEIIEELKTLGLDTSQWKDVDQKKVPPIMMDQQKETLIQLRDILQQALDKDQAQLRQLREQVARLKHGGGA